MPALLAVPLHIKPLHCVAFIQLAFVCVHTYDLQSEYTIAVYGGYGYEKVPGNSFIVCNDVSNGFGDDCDCVCGGDLGHLRR